MSYDWKPYVPVAQRRAQAEKAAQKASKAGKGYTPIRVEGRSIAKTFWGKAWCEHLESCSDYANRLPRGRTYVRNGSVIDLKIEPGKVKALVMGSSLYQIEIGMAPLPAAHWQKLVQACAGSIATLVELLQGRFSKAVMEQLCAPKTGLFPTPKEIQLGCSCPDWASMCKHVAAALYGVGAQLDAKPELLFVLRQVDANDLLTVQATAVAKTKKAPAKARLLDDSALADVFGLELAGTPAPAKLKRKPKFIPVPASTATSAAKKQPSRTLAKPAQAVDGQENGVKKTKRTAPSKPATPKSPAKAPRPPVTAKPAATSVTKPKPIVKAKPAAKKPASSAASPTKRRSSKTAAA
ncbi:MAG: hypothetical protein KBD60_06425 [Sterolibacterium sp.]|nr:hypothetical protein [Sterolibacterium sp.]